MTRCSCDTACSCILTAGDNITITGNGNPGTEYIISASGGGGGSENKFAIQLGVGTGGAAATGPTFHTSGFELSLLSAAAGPHAIVASATVANFLYYGDDSNVGGSGWTVTWTVYVSNVDCTETLSASINTTDMTGGVGGVQAPPAAGWTVSRTGTDLNLVDVGGHAAVTTTAGGAFWADLFIQFVKNP